MIDFLLTKSVEILVDMGYWGVFLSALGLFPTEVVITLFSAAEESSMWLIAVVASLGAVIGGIPTYFLGYLFTEDVLYKWLNGKGSFLRIDTKSIDESKKKIRKRAFLYIFITRLIPWLRVVASIAAGYVKTGIVRYSIAVFLGMFLYTILLSVIGAEAGHNWDEIQKYLNTIDRGVIALIIGSTLTYFLYKSKKKVIQRIRK
jgi:membrane protein DedA with SNARE-associated domain